MTSPAKSINNSAAGGGGGGSIFQFKLVLLGESAVGKSSLVLRFVNNEFDDNREATIGAVFLTQKVRLEGGSTVKFEIWDTAGQERYKSLAPMYYRNAKCAVVVYDITQRASLDKAQAWVAELRRHAAEGIIIVLAGNKTDLEDARQVETSVAEEYAEQEGLIFFETSAKNGTNVRELFEAIAHKLPLEQQQRLQQQQQQQQRRGNNLGSVDLTATNNNNGGKESCAC